MPDFARLFDEPNATYVVRSIRESNKPIGLTSLGNDPPVAKYILLECENQNGGQETTRIPHLLSMNRNFNEEKEVYMDL